MSNNKLYKLSICITDLANLPDQAVKKASNGKHYLNCSLWINEQENEYGSIGTISVDQKNNEENIFQDREVFPALSDEEVREMFMKEYENPGYIEEEYPNGCIY